VKFGYRVSFHEAKWAPTVTTQIRFSQIEPDLEFIGQLGEAVTDSAARFP